jgi:NAD(P)-dependent dehydrogenase (short-subunit alcohol dehydrogenase family)
MDVQSLFGLAGKGALVVGGGRGIGLASAQLLSAAGASVAILDVDTARAQTVSNRFTELGRRSVAITADVLDGDQVQNAVRTAASELGRLDVLVHVVGMAVWAPLTEMRPDDFDLDLTRNMRYVVRSSAEFARLPGQATKGRAIVNIASIAGITASVNHGAYGAAKAALMSLTKTMAVEWGPLGIRVNSIAPGTIATDGHVVEPSVAALRSRAIPLRRVGVQEDIGKAVLFLASDLAGYVTGQTLVVDGGILCRTPLPGVDPEPVA